MSKENRKLTRAVRERMARTDEKYVTARMHILAALGEEPGPGVTVVTTVERVLGRYKLRLDVRDAGVRVFLDGLDLGEIPAHVAGKRARVADGEYPLSEGWTARVAPEYMEPDQEAGVDGGWRTGSQVEIVPPAHGGLSFGGRPSLVSLEFDTDGGVCGTGWSGPSVLRVKFNAPYHPPVLADVETLPVEGDVSINVLDYHRRTVLRVARVQRPDDTDYLVELSEPLVPEGAWSLADPHFGPGTAAPNSHQSNRNTGMTGSALPVGRSVYAPYLGNKDVLHVFRPRLGEIARTHGATEGLQLAFENNRANLLVFFLPEVSEQDRQAIAATIFNEYIDECESRMRAWVSDTLGSDENHPGAMVYEDANLLRWYVTHEQGQLSLTGPVAPFPPVKIPEGMGVEEAATRLLVGLGFIPPVG